MEDPALDVLVGVLGFELLPNAVSSSVAPQARCIENNYKCNVPMS